MAEAEVGTKLIFDNEQIKVWEFTLAPGEEIAAHTLGGGTLEMRRGTRVDQATLEAGTVYFRRGGDTHAARNIGGRRYHEVLVELKAPR